MFHKNRFRKCKMKFINYTMFRVFLFKRVQFSYLHVIYEMLFKSFEKFDSLSSIYVIYAFLHSRMIHFKLYKRMNAFVSV